MQPLKVYGAPRTRAFRVVWLLEELELPYQLERVEFKRTQAEFFIQSTPTGKIPNLVDGELVLAESGAIVEYVLARYGQGRLIPDGEAHGHYLQWFHFAESTAFPPLGVVVWLTRYRTDAADHPELVKDAVHRATTTLGQVEEHLQSNPYLAGEEFTAADIMMGFTLLAAQQILPDYNPPATGAYLQKIMARAAAQKALAALGT